MTTSESDNNRPVKAPLGTTLAELDGRLCMVRDLRRRGDIHAMFELWKLQDQGSGSWSLDYRIDRIPYSLMWPRLVVPLCYTGQSREIVLVTTA